MSLNELDLKSVENILAAFVERIEKLEFRILKLEEDIEEIIEGDSSG